MNQEKNGFYDYIPFNLKERKECHIYLLEYRTTGNNVIAYTEKTMFPFTFTLNGI